MKKIIVIAICCSILCGLGYAVLQMFRTTEYHCYACLDTHCAPSLLHQHYTLLFDAKGDAKTAVCHLPEMQPSRSSCLSTPDASFQFFCASMPAWKTLPIPFH